MDELIEFLKQENVRQFIKENVGTDIHKLILNPPRKFKDQIKEISGQIQARQKAKGKLNSWVTNFDLIMPPALSIEQASSEATCRYKKGLTKGKNLIDLTGGMGIDCLAFSEQFEQTTYVEDQLNLCRVFKHNSKALRKEINIINTSAESFLSNLENNLTDTIIYLDPARRDEQKKRVFRIEDCSPNLIELLPLLEGKAHRVLVKFSPILDLHAAVASIEGVKEIHIVSVKNDCKEILLLIDFGHSESIRINAINLESGQPNYAFDFKEEANSIAQYGELKKYLLEPNSSIMKAGAFKKIAQDFSLVKLSENTHLYTSDEPIENFPGRAFEVFSRADKKTIMRFASNGKMNVLTRNYPLNANELKRKWKLKDGGDFFLIAFCDSKERPRMIIAQKVDRPK